MAEPSKFQNGFVQFFLGALVLGTTLCVVGGTGAFVYGWNGWTKAGPLQTETSIIIPRGSGVSTIAATLEDQGVIEDALLFKAMARITGHHTNLKAGEYAFAPQISMRSVIDKIERGDVVQRRVTVPEGLTSHQIVKIVNGTDGLSGTITDIPAEGSLLPETYSFLKDQDRTEIITQMQTAMTDAITQMWPTRDPGLPFDTIEQAVTLASIVEKETGIGDERKRVAGVFINRLRMNMPLQSDPTVIYAITKGDMKDDGMGPLGRRLLRKDLTDTDSPYNTYKYPGLPPGPIANPGKASIDAVLHPEQHNYIYFVADGEGGHVFARTLAEHQNNVNEWRKIRKAKEED